MAEFNSVITVTAGQAIGELGRLDTALDQTEKAMLGFQTTADKSFGGKGIKDTTNQIENMGRRGKKALADVDGAAKKAGKSINAIGLSYKDVGRIIESQIIFSAISNITQGFFEAADAAAEFQEQLARIAAIDESDLGFSGLRDEIEKLAQELGRPLEEVGEAAFEALQNDIGTTSETFDILRKDAKELAQVTGGTLPQAVNALSSVYKTFGREAEGVESISGQFFGTINAGRITLADLESSLGTLSPLAGELGVNFKELTDGLATITLTGTKANVASTQLRNVFNKLIKPTDALKKVYQELGVSGFEELSNRIGADGDRLGLVGALDVLRKEVGGSEDGLARLFNTIRGNLGVLNLLTNDTELYERTAQRSADSAKELGAAIAGIESTAAFEANKNAAELEVIFTRLGDIALDAKNAAVNLFLAITQGSTEGVAAISALTLGIGGATIAVTKFGVAASVAFPPVIAALAVLAGAAVVAKGIDAVGKSIFAVSKATAELEVERLEAFVKTLKQLREAEVDAVVKQLENVETVVNRIAGAAKETGKQLQDAFNIKAANIKAVEASLLQQFGDVRNRVLKQIEDAIKSIDDAIIEGTRRISSLTAELDEIKFEFSIEGLNEAAQASARMQRATEATSKAIDLINKSGLGEESQKSAQAAIQQARADSESALSAARRTKSETLIQEAKRQVISAVELEIGLETRLNNLRKNVGVKALTDQQKAFERISAQAKQQVKEALDARAAIGEAIAKGADADTVNQLKEGFQKEVKEARDALQETGEEAVLKTFSLEEPIQNAIDALNKGLNETGIDWENAIKQLQEDLANATDLKAAVELTASISKDAATNEALNKVVQDAIGEGGLPGEQLENTQKAVVEFFKEQKQLSDVVQDSSAKAQLGADKARLAFANAVSEWNTGSREALKLVDPVLERLSGLGDLNKQQLEQLIKNLQAALPAIQEQTTGLFGTFTEEQKANLTAGIKAAIEAAQAQAEGLEAKNLFKPENLTAVNSLIDKLSTTEFQDLNFDIDAEGAQAIEGTLDDIKRKGDLSKEAVKKIGTEGAVQANKGIIVLGNTTQGLVTKAANATSAYQKLLNMAKEALRIAQEAASLSNSVSNNFFGGRPTPQFRNNGGNSRGQDTVPAMLSPDEFVVNSKSSRDFLPQLNAINAGNAVSNTGGVGDTNITIGDVNVTSTSDVPSQSARDIALALKRELRRGTSR